MNTRIVVMLAVVALSARASAHHSFAAFYFEDQSVSIAGVVTEFHYVNPHAWVYISALDVPPETHRAAVRRVDVGGPRRAALTPALPFDEN
jgi:hypothetical protein